MTFFTKNRKTVAHADNIIVTLLTSAVVRFFLLSTFENPFLTMKNSCQKALVPSRRVNYYKHVKFDLRDDITSRDVTKKVRICLQNMQQGPDVRVTLLKIRS